MRNAAKWGVVLLASLGFLAAGCGSSSCPSHFKTCGNVCVDVYTDPANCGACGTACAGGQVCSAGACGLSCAATETVCGGTCRDLQTDSNNCGTCGKTCGPGQACSAGACGCPIPGMAQCGPKALVYSDGATASFVQPIPDAVGAMGLLKGSVVYGASGAQFNTEYDADQFDVIFFDVSNFGVPAGAPARLYDWVNCGGRLVYNNYGYTTWEQTLLQITASAGFNPNRPTYADPSSPANLFSGIYSVPSPLAMSAAPIAWGSFGVEPTPAPPTAGFVAARYNSATGPNAIAVTNNNHVIVHGFLPSDYQAVDTNANGIPDLQELYVNEVAYLVKQGPPGLVCSAIENFEVGPWPIAPWTLAAGGTAYGSLTAACAHDGANGFSDGGLGGGQGDWYVRTDVSVGAPGQKLSMWFKTPATASTGAILLGFGSTATKTWSVYAAPFSGFFYLISNPTYATYTSLASAAQTYAVSTWYRMEVEFGTGGAVTGRLYASDGVTVLNTLTATIAGFTPGGVAIHSFGSSGSACLDTIKSYH